MVNPLENGWECVYQRAHAWMSFQMLLEFEPGLRTPEWPAILQAALTHDHGWMEWDEACLDGQAPDSFTVSGVDKALKITSRGVELAAHQSLDAAVFVARHIEELYSRRAEGPLVDHLAQIREQRLGWMRELELSEEAVERGYQRVLWADSASLILCVADQEFVSELSLKIDETVYQLAPTGEHWTLEPWPYITDELVVSVQSRILEQQKFASEQQLRSALAATEPRSKKWILRPLETGVN